MKYIRDSVRAKGGNDNYLDSTYHNDGSCHTVHGNPQLVSSLKIARGDDLGRIGNYCHVVERVNGYPPNIFMSEIVVKGGFVLYLYKCFIIQYVHTSKTM